MKSEVEIRESLLEAKDILKESIEEKSFVDIAEEAFWINAMEWVLKD